MAARQRTPEQLARDKERKRRRASRSDMPDSRYISTTQVRCPACQRTVNGPMHQPGERRAKCGGCETIFSYQIAFVSPPLTVFVPTETVQKQESRVSVPTKKVQKTPVTDLDSTDGDGDWETAMEQCDRIISMCEEVRERGEDFAFGVMERTESIKGWIEENKTVTSAQLEALDNMESGVGRWLDH